MRVINLTVENVKRIKAVEITPKEDVILISGKNGAGKSSLIDAMWWALGGSKTVQKKPIREGEAKAKTVLDLGDYIVTR